MLSPEETFYLTMCVLVFIFICVYYILYYNIYFHLFYIKLNDTFKIFVSHCLPLNEIFMTLFQNYPFLIKTIGNVGWCVINIIKGYYSQNTICTMQILLFRWPHYFWKIVKMREIGHSLKYLPIFLSIFLHIYEYFSYMYLVLVYCIIYEEIGQLKWFMHGTMDL